MSAQMHFFHFCYLQNIITLLFEDVGEIILYL